MDNTESSTQSPKSGMPKTTIALIVVIIVLLAAAGGYMAFGKNLLQKPASPAPKTAAAAPSPTTGSVISSIREALAGSQSLQCDFTDEGGRKTVSYMKAGKVRSDFTTTDTKQSGSMIMKDKKVYFWNGKTGTTMSFDLDAMSEKLTQTPKMSPAANTGQKPQDFVDSLEKYKQSCKPATVDDALFTPPADVKFTDLTSMMQQGSKMMPSGVPSAMPSAMSQEQIKALQEQYQK